MKKTIKPHFCKKESKSTNCIAYLILLRAETLINEVSILEAQLKDYNFILEKIHLGTNGKIEKDEINSQIQLLRDQNKKNRERVDELFRQRNRYVRIHQNRFTIILQQGNPNTGK
jgi:hypothetical protein